MRNKLRANSVKAALHEAASAFSRVKASPKLLLIAMASDIAFFLAYGFVTAPLFRKIVEYITIIGTSMSEKAAAVIRGTNPSIGSMLINDEEVKNVLISLLLVYILLAVSVYIVYTFFHSISWKMSSAISGRKIGMYNYMKEFAVLSIFWFALFALSHLLSLFAELRESALKAMNAEPSSLLTGISTVFLFAIIYFAAISYTLIGRHSTKEKIRKSFVIGIRGVGLFLPVAAVIAVAFFALKLIMESAATVNFWLMMAAGFLLVMPAMTWLRVYLTSIAGKARLK